MPKALAVAYRYVRVNDTTIALGFCPYGVRAGAYVLHHIVSGGIGDRFSVNCASGAMCADRHSRKKLTPDNEQDYLRLEILSP